MNPRAARARRRIRARGAVGMTRRSITVRKSIQPSGAGVIDPGTKCIGFLSGSPSGHLGVSATW